jgi:hypothetical protein
MSVAARSAASSYTASSNGGSGSTSSGVATGWASHSSQPGYTPSGHSLTVRYCVRSTRFRPLPAGWRAIEAARFVASDSQSASEVVGVTGEDAVGVVSVGESDNS